LKFTLPQSEHQKVVHNGLEAFYGSIGIGYGKCEWLFNSEGEQGYRVKLTGVTTFPKDRKQLKNTITKCLNRGIEYGGTVEFRNRFFNDAHRIMQAVFQKEDY